MNMRSYQWTIRIILISHLFLCLSACRPKIEALPIDDTPRIAVMSAFDAEQQALLAETREKQAQVINGRTYTTGTLAGQPVVLVTTGVSMVNAAMTTQTLLDHFTVQAVVVSGIAGGVNPALHVGDVTVPARWGQYQEQTFVRAEEDGFAVPAGAPFGGYGMMVPGPVEAVRAAGRPDQAVEIFWFPVDPTLLAAAETAAQAVTLERCPPLGGCLSETPRIVTGGSGVSGPTFVDNAEYRAWVWDAFQADALDMETAAVAHVAYTNGVPYIAFRSLSDLAGGGLAQNELLSFYQLAAAQSARVVTAFLSAME